MFFGTYNWTPYQLYICIGIETKQQWGIYAATEQIRAKQYAGLFKADKRKVVALAIELDNLGKGLTNWKEV